MNKEIYMEFNNLLRTRLQKSIFTTEDSVRYTFYVSLLTKGGLKPEDIILEQPHNVLNGAEIDTYIQHYGGNSVMIEFKYDRSIPSGKNTPRPQKAGKLCSDIKRLLEFQTDKPEIRLFVYLIDEEMALYMRNPRNNLNDFFELKIGAVLKIDQQFFFDKSDTFQTAAGGIFQAQIFCDWRSSLPKQHELRIYRILKGNCQ